jgi:predicted transcriptional regulator
LYAVKREQAKFFGGAMPRLRQEDLTLRESQIMDVVWDLGEASVEDIQTNLDVDLVDSTIRMLLNIMERKGYVGFHKQGKAKIFHALVPREEMQRSALRNLTKRLFKGSADSLLTRLVEDEEVGLEELDRLRRRLRRRQKEEEP